MTLYTYLYFLNKDLFCFDCNFFCVMWTIFKVFTGFITILLLFYVFIVVCLFVLAVRHVRS